MKLMKSSFLGMLFFSSNLFRAEAQNELQVYGTKYDEPPITPDFLNYEDNYIESNHDVHDKPNQRRSLTVFPPDARVEYSTVINQRGVGLLSSTNNGTFKNCTATLINRELILTAAKCVYQDTLDANGTVVNRIIPDEWKSSALFQFGYTNGHQSQYNSEIKKIFVPNAFINVAPNWPEFDFAILQLTQALGDATGFMKIKSIAATSYDNQGVSLVSFMFKNDTTASADYCCSIIGNIDGRAKHICDTAYGSAGAPLYTQSQSKKTGKFGYHIVAMNNEEGPTFNLAAATKPIAALFSYAKNHINRNPRFKGERIDFSNDCEIICNTDRPTSLPTTSPTSLPTTSPTTLPTSLPTVSPIASPSFVPTFSPTKVPAIEPTTEGGGVTNRPTRKPPSTPKPHRPTRYPHHRPTTEPTTGGGGVTDRPTRAQYTRRPTTEPTTGGGGVTDRPTRAQYTHRPTTERTKEPTTGGGGVTDRPTHPEHTRRPTTERTKEPTTGGGGVTDRPTHPEHTRRPTTERTKKPTTGGGGITDRPTHPEHTRRPTNDHKTDRPTHECNQYSKCETGETKVNGNRLRM